MDMRETELVTFRSLLGTVLSELNSLRVWHYKLPSGDPEEAVTETNTLAYNLGITNQQMSNLFVRCGLAHYMNSGNKLIIRLAKDDKWKAFLREHNIDIDQGYFNKMETGKSGRKDTWLRLGCMYEIKSILEVYDVMEENGKKDQRRQRLNAKTSFHPGTQTKLVCEGVSRGPPRLSDRKLKSFRRKLLSYTTINFLLILIWK